jgi:acyl carrier protein
VLYLYQSKNGSVTSNVNASGGKAEPTTASEIEAWLISYLAELLDLEGDEIEVNSSFQSYGLSSAEGVGLIGDLRDLLGDSLNPALLYEYPNIATLSAKLIQNINQNQTL